jgi:hypothetical protein
MKESPNPTFALSPVQVPGGALAAHLRPAGAGWVGGGWRVGVFV